VATGRQQRTSHDAETDKNHEEKKKTSKKEKMTLQARG
jgi:hypothetical protein